MLGERVTTEITKNKDREGFGECKTAAKEGGEVAGNARIEAERKIGKRVSTKDNYKKITQKEKKD